MDFIENIIENLKQDGINIPVELEKNIQNFKNTKFTYITERNELLKNVYAQFVNIFDSNLKNLIDYSHTKDILLDFTNMPELDSHADIFDFFQANHQVDEKLGIDNIFFVRKTDVIPKDDKIITALNGLEETIEQDFSIGDAKYSTNTSGASLTYSSSTVHFAINREVLSHVASWDDKKIIIIQPLTDKVYDQMVQFDPLDTFCLNDFHLDGFVYILCPSKEIANEILKNNKNCIPLIFSPDKILGKGNKIVTALGGRAPFKLYDNGISIGPYDIYYDEEVLKKYPKIGVTPTYIATETPEHQVTSDIRALIRDVQIYDSIFEICKDINNLDELFALFDSGRINYEFSHVGRYMIQLKKKNIDISQLFPEKHESRFAYLDELLGEALKTPVDSQKIFEIITKDSPNLTHDILLRIKEKIILCTEKLNQQLLEGKYKEDELKSYDNFIHDIVRIHEISKSKLVEKGIDKTISPRVPLKYYDFSNFENYVNGIIANSQESNHDLFAQIGQAVIEDAETIQSRNIAPVFDIHPPTTVYSNELIGLLEKKALSNDDSQIESIILNEQLSEEKKEGLLDALRTYCSRYSEAKTEEEKLVMAFNFISICGIVNAPVNLQKKSHHQK